MSLLLEILKSIKNSLLHFEAGIVRLLIQFPGFPVCIHFDPILFENEG